MSPAYRVIFALVALPTVLWAQCGLLCAQDAATLDRPEDNDIAKPIRVTGNHQELLQQDGTTVITVRGGLETDGLAKLNQGELQLQS